MAKVADNKTTGTPIQVKGRKMKVKSDADGKESNLQSAQNFELTSAETKPSEPAKAVENPKWYELGTAFPTAACRPYLPDKVLTFTETTLKELPEVLPPDGRRWAGMTFTSKQWAAVLLNWELAFPKVEGAKIETQSECDKRKLNLRTHCWETANKTNLSHHDSMESNEFRIDIFGNVISQFKTDQDGALCFWDMDHIFPWSRGGRSVLANFAPVQWCANRYVKSDKLLQTLDRVSLQCGISQAQFESLLRHADALGGDCRRNRSYHRSQAKGWLTQAPKKGFALVRFQELVSRSADGGVLWRFLHAWAAQQEAQNAPDWGALVARARGGAPEGEADDSPAGATPPPRAPQRPAVYMRCTGDAVEVYGRNTVYLHRHPSRVFASAGFRWDPDDGRRCWYFAAQGEAERQAAAEAIRTAAAAAGWRVELVQR